MTVANLPVRDDDDRVPIHVVEGIDGGEQVDTSRGPGVGWFDRIRLKYLAQATAASLIAVTGTVLYFLPVADPATETAIRGGAAVVHYYASVSEEDQDGKRETTTSRCTDTLIREGGQWLYLGWFCFNEPTEGS